MNVRRWIRRFAWGLAGLVAVLLLLLVAGLTVDLGPLVRARAETAASTFLQRPMHIGRIGWNLFTGHFVVENLVIEGKTPQDRPFFSAKRIEVSLARGALGSGWYFYRARDFVINTVEMTDWDMQVELKDGGDNLPNFKPKNPSTGQRTYVVTVNRVHAYRGQFTYVDHGTWRVTTSPNLDVVVNNEKGEYRGRAQFSNGSVKIKDYQPLRLAFRSDYKIDGGKVHLNWIDLATDGSHSFVSGDVDLGNWPEMLFKVHTDHVDFPHMKGIFFKEDRFTVAGEGKFTGTFHVFKHRPAPTSFELKGVFTSPLTTLNGWAHFRDLAGDLRWVPDRFDVTKTAMRFERGRVDLTFAIAPIGRAEPTLARLDTAYTDVDMAGLTDVLQTKGLRVAGRATGRNVLEWPTGHFREHRGGGELTIRPTDATPLYTRTSEPRPRELPVGPTFSSLGVVPDLGYLPVAAALRYDFGPEWVNVAPSTLSTPYTYVEFSGRTAYGDQSALDFYARSGDWQESERLLSAAITAFGSPTRTVVLAGYGEFTGRMLNSFRHPRIEGSFDGRDIRAFDVTWGHARGNVVVENSYVDVTDGLVTQGPTSEIRVDGRFSLSTAREDRGDELNARVRLTDWPIADVRHAFELDAYPIDGHIGGDYHVFGAYRRPFGYGTMTVARAVAYGEPIEQGTALLRLEGTGARVDQVVMTKAGGTITGNAYVGWDGRYSFEAAGARIPMESLEAVKYPEAPLSGLVTFQARGSSTFANPKFDITSVQITDLFVKDEGIGQVTGRLAIADRLMTLQMEAASPRLRVSGSGQISLIPGADADLSFRITETSLDPFFRVFQPGLSPFTTATASGTLRAVGQVGDLKRFRVDASVDQLRMRLYDYDISNAGPIVLGLDNQVVRLGGVTAAGQERQPLRLEGKDPASGRTTTRLNLLGDVDLGAERVGVRADGDADLAVLQGFFRDIRSSGHARVAADIQGPLREPAFAGEATIDNGRIRYSSLNSIDAINGTVKFTAGGIRFGDPATGKELTAQVGGGTVTFTGGIGMTGFVPSRWAIHAEAENVHLRYPEGFNSVVDATLDLAGPYSAPTLKGTVDVRSAVLSRTIDITPSLVELASAARSAGGSGAAAGAAAPAAPPAFPLRFDLGIIARSTLRVENNFAHLVASADLRLGGTYDRPTLLGRAEVERGYFLYVGKRYVLTRGAIEFNNPAKIDPFFDVEAEVRARVPGQTYVIDLQAIGTTKNLSFPITSDPPLSTEDAISLLLGDARSPVDVRNPELRSLQPHGALERGRLVQGQLEQILLSTGALNRAVGSAFGLTTFQLTPSLLDEFQRFNPTARLTIGKQISPRIYLTISRSLYSPQEDVIYLLEFDQNDRVSWVLSRNEDKTYALDVRMRYRF